VLRLWKKEKKEGPLLVSTLTFGLNGLYDDCGIANVSGSNHSTHGVFMF
jgi:hypothetical protein